MRELSLKSATPVVARIVDSVLSDSIPSHTMGCVGYFEGRSYFLRRIDGMRKYHLSPWPVTAGEWLVQIEFDALETRNLGATRLLGMSIDHGEDQFYRDIILLKMIT